VSRVKSLATLIKFQKTKVDEQRIVLARAQDTLNLIDRAIAQLEEQKKREQAAVTKDPAHAHTYGEFLKQAIRRARALAKERKIAEATVEAAREKLSELFEEQKRYEIAEAERIKTEEREELRRETAELDEIGGVTHERNKAETR
jgi:flagellar export protein FliJ